MTGYVPLTKIFREITVMKPMNQQFDPFLGMFVRRIFPKMFEIGNNRFSIINNFRGDNIKDFFIRVVDQMEQGRYFVVRFQWRMVVMICNFIIEGRIK